GRTPPLSRSEVRSMIGDGSLKLVERALAARPGAAVDLADASARFLTLYEAAPAVRTTVFPGVLNTLERLRTMGVPLALCTNKPEGATRRLLEALGLASYFCSVVGGDTLPWRKPDRRVLDTILSQRGVAPEHAMLVGDSEIDAAAAMSAGVPFVLVTYGYRRQPAEAIDAWRAIDRFDELLAFIGAER